MDRAPGNEMKGESAPDFNTPGFEPGTQWSKVECSTAQPSAPRFCKNETITLNVTDCIQVRHKLNHSINHPFIHFSNQPINQSIVSFVLRRSTTAFIVQDAVKCEKGSDFNKVLKMLTGSDAALISQSRLFRNVRWGAAIETARLAYPQISLTPGTWRVSTPGVKTTDGMQMYVH